MNLALFADPPQSPVLSQSAKKAKPYVANIGSLLLLLMVLGLTLSVLVFYLVRTEVDGIYLNTMEQPILREVNLARMRLDADVHLVDALSGLLNVRSDISRDDAVKFIENAQLDEGAAAYIAISVMHKDSIDYRQKILDRPAPGYGAFNPAQLTGLDDAVRMMASGTDVKTAMLKNADHPDETWVVHGRAVRTGSDTGRAVIVFSPLSSIFKELFNRYTTGKLQQLTIGDYLAERTSGDKINNIVTLQSPEDDFNTWFAHPRLVEHLHAGKMLWLVGFISTVNRQSAVVAILPHVGFTIVVVLTLLLIAYLNVWHKRSLTAMSMTESLTQANEELKRKFTEETRLARALAKSEQRYRSLFDNAGIGIFQVNDRGMWTNANLMAANLLGYNDASDLLAAQPGRMGHLFVHTHEREDWLDHIQHDTRHATEIQFYTKDRRVIWVHVNARPIVNDETGERFCECTLYDVSERRRAEMGLMSAKEQADFANRSKSEFLANMSHELRTPLNAIIGFAEIIKDQLFGAAGQPQYVEYAKDIYDSGALLLSLINDILDMSKIEAGKRDLAEANLDIAKLVRSVVVLVDSRAKMGRVKLTCDIPKNFPMLRAEERAMKQILTNLLTNAIKFTPEGGQVSLVATLDMSGCMRISVDDTGIGIAPEDVQVALAPFGQIESALSRKHQGTGLGLPLTKALVELHNGVLDLRSKLGKGTSVTLIFPAERVLKPGVPSLPVA